MNEPLVLFFLLLASAHCQIYISEGSDGSGGHYPTLYDALQATGTSPTTIYVYPGVYTEYHTSVISSTIKIESFNKSAPNPKFQCSHNLTGRLINVSFATSFSLVGIDMCNCNNSDGALLYINSVTTVTFDSCRFYNSTAPSLDGGVKIIGSGVTISDCEFWSNNAVATGSSLVLYDSTGSLSNNIFRNNNANLGGAILLAKKCQLMFSNVTMRQNSALIRGGAIDMGGLITGSSIVIQDSLFEGNMVTNSTNTGGGGAIFVARCLLLKNVTFRDNNSTGYGGAINHAFVFNATAYDNITIENSTFDNNKALYGGAMFLNMNLWNSSLSRHFSLIKTSMFSNNKATVYGGALYLTIAYALALDTVQIVNNIASDGGGIYSGITNALSIRYTTITQNQGSGFYCNTPYVEIANSSIYQNSVDFNCVLPTCNITGLEDACTACSQRDICSVCQGNSMCVGCDMKPYSSIVNDSCGICGGNNSCLTTGTTATTETTGVTTTSTAGTTNAFSITSPSASSTKQTTIIIAVVASAAGLILLGLIVFFVIRRKRNHKSNEQIPLESVVPKKITEIKDIVIGQRLGGGNFSDVYEGVWQGTTKVAVKLLKSQGEMKEFIQESEMLHSLNHPNILRFLGIFYMKDQQYIVTELMSESLLSYLIHNNKRLGAKEYTDISLQVAAGMCYLESCNIVHRDLACRNLLVSAEETPSVKIADLGLARSAEKQIYKSKGAAIPIKWSAPEVLKHGISTSLSDSWSFGIVLWEIYSGGQIPYISLSNEEVVERVNSGYRMPPPLNTPLKIEQLMASCWNEEPEKRPRFSEIFHQLSSMVIDKKEKLKVNSINFTTQHYQ